MGRRCVKKSVTASAVPEADKVVSDEPAGDDGFCFDLCLPPLPALPPEMSTRAYFFVNEELPLVDRRQAKLSSGCDAKPDADF